MDDETREATDEEMVRWLRLRTDSDPVPIDEKLIAVRLAEKLQRDLAAAERSLNYWYAQVKQLGADKAALLIRAEKAEAEIVALRENDACLDALNLLWQDIILAHNPDYGDWEYPGQAYRHIKAEHDEALARVAELERLIDSASGRSIDGIIYRVLPDPIGRSTDAHNEE